MKSQQEKIYLNTPVERAIDTCDKNKLNHIIVFDFKKQSVGELFVDSLLKAEKHHLNLYPVSILVQYEETKPVLTKKIKKEVILERINSLLPKHIQEVLLLCSTQARQNNLQAYLIGGIVRDILRNEINLDIDLTVDSNALDFAQSLASSYDSISIKEKHPDFGTAKLLFSVQDTLEEIDLASTRQEYYQYPGALPTIQEFCCPIAYDLFRRDFTINAMAINITHQSYGELIDPYGGADDIQNKIIRVLHSYSFIDDPTRIIRAIKFACRFNYQFSSATKKLAQECIHSGLFDNFCTERLKYELKSLLNLNDLKVISYIAELKLYKLLDYSIYWDKSSAQLFEQLNNRINQFKEYIHDNNIWLIYLAAILHSLPEDHLDNVLNNLFLTNTEKESILNGLVLNKKISSGTIPVKPSEIHDLYNRHSVEAIIISTINYPETQIDESIKKYLEQYSKVKINTTGETLINLGLTPGTIFSEILKKLLEEKLNGTIQTAEDEINFVKKHFLIQ